MLWMLIGVSVALCLAAIGASAWYVKRNYLGYRDRADQLLSQLLPAEAAPPAAFGQIVLQLNAEGYEYFVASSLVNEFHASPTRMRDRPLRILVWQYLLPRRIGQDGVMALYAHFMPFEGGRGIAYGAQHYYQKTPAELSRRELLELYVISLSPHRNSPNEHPERFEAEVRRRQHILGEPAA